MRFLFLIGVVPSLVLAFDMNGLSELDSYTAKNNTDPLELVSERLVFNPKSSLGSFEHYKDAQSHRYFNYQPAQQGNGAVIGYRFSEELSRGAINEKKVTLSRVTFLQNEWKSLKFRTFEIASDGKSMATYQECWQLDKVPNVQCALVNKSICDRVNRGNYDWNKNYRNDAQAFRKQMNDRFKAEVLPEVLNEKLSLSFKKYEVLEDYDYKPKELLFALGSGVQVRLEKICKSFTWLEESAVEAGFKH